MAPTNCITASHLSAFGEFEKRFHGVRHGGRQALIQRHDCPFKKVIKMSKLYINKNIMIVGRKKLK
jgi:hypothetical protein